MGNLEAARLMGIGVASYASSRLCMAVLDRKRKTLMQEYNLHMGELFGKLIRSHPEKTAPSVGGNYFQLAFDITSHFCGKTGPEHPDCLAMKNEVDAAQTKVFAQCFSKYYLFGTVQKTVMIVITCFATLAANSLCPADRSMFAKAYWFCASGIIFGALPAVLAPGWYYLSQVSRSCGADENV